MKVHVAIGQYEFIEEEFKSIEDARQFYIDAVMAWREPVNPAVQVGLDDKTWRTVLDKYLTDNTMHHEEYFAMNAEQQRIIQEIKKSLKRLVAKEITAHND